MFKQASDNAFLEIEDRKRSIGKVLKFGIESLDHAYRGIFQDDLVLLGAPSGVGKTQLCCNIALSNLKDGRRVHYIALEAAEHEIERRLKFPMVMDRYYKDQNPDRPKLGKVSYVDWYLGKFVNELEYYETQAAIEFKQNYEGLFLFYKEDHFGINQLIEHVSRVSKETDLIIVDHVHYFDFDDDNENRAIKEIAMTARNLAIHKQKPIVLVAHLRKRDRNSDELIAGQEDFHGSSDLYKVATKVITLAGGKPTTDGTYETFFRIAKNRIDGGTMRFSTKEFFDPKTGGYQYGKYQVGWCSQSRDRGFEPVEEQYYPDWARSREVDKRRSDGDPIPKGRNNWFDKD